MPTADRKIQWIILDKIHKTFAAGHSLTSKILNPSVPALLLRS